MSSASVLILSLVASTLGTDFQIDPNGYVVFCPCMGRFGNQVDQLLGVMQFTKYLDRTLVLPNFIEYPYPDTVMVPFESIFQVTEIRKYLKAIRMVAFQREVMPKLWPKENRTGDITAQEVSQMVICDMLKENPIFPQRPISFRLVILPHVWQLSLTAIFAMKSFGNVRRRRDLATVVGSPWRIDSIHMLVTVSALCWSPRKSIYDENAPVGCHAKEGNPFGPYWDKIGVSFAHDAYYGQLPGGYDLTVRGSKTAWLERFPPSQFPVLAFPSPPAPFPSRAVTWELQRYLKWSSRIIGKATQFIKDKLTRPFVGIHLRNDKDWERVCEHIPSTPASQPLFASMQCEGQEFYDGKLTKEICSPSASTVVEQVVDVVGKIGARSVFVSSDKDHMIETLNDALRAYDVTAFRLNPDDALVSLAILGQADHFIGNCVSTFSHIVRRERTVSKPLKPTSYFGIRGQERRMEL